MIAKLKGLRGTALDPFGRHPERKMERALISQYEADMAQVVAEHGAKASDAAVALAELPLQIKGFGPVKVADILKNPKNRPKIQDHL